MATHRMKRKSWLRIVASVLIVGFGGWVVWSFILTGYHGALIENPLIQLKATPNAVDIMGPLKVDPVNPRYFQDPNGRAIFLTGSHTWDNRQDLGGIAFDYSQYLQILQDHHHNFIRLYVWEQPSGITTWPDPAQPNATLTPEIFLRTGPGNANDEKLKFDLTKYNSTHFDRLRERVIDARARGIYVSIMLFNGWSVEQKAGGANPWINHPFNIANNINGINGDPNGDQSGTETHTLQIPEVVALQEAYIRKVVDTVNDLDNVMYEVSNESDPDSTTWQYHIINYIKDYETEKPLQHPIGMTAQYPDANNSDLLASPADWISPVGMEEYGDLLPPADGNKVSILDTDHIWGIGGDRNWAWKSFTRGYNLIYMDPWNGTFIPVEANEDLRVNMGYILAYAERMNLEMMFPHPELCSTSYCLANPSSVAPEYLVFLPSGRIANSILHTFGFRSEDHKRLSSIQLALDDRVTIDLSTSSVELAVEWFDPEDGMVYTGQTLQGGNSSEALFAPFMGDAILYIHALQSPSDADIQK